MKPGHIWALPLCQYLFVGRPCSQCTLNSFGLGPWPMLTDQIWASDIMLLGDWDLVMSLLCMRRGTAVDSCPCASPHCLFANLTHTHTHSQSRISESHECPHGELSCSWHSRRENSRGQDECGKDSWGWKEREREHWEQIKRLLWGNCDNHSAQQRKERVNFTKSEVQPMHLLLILTNRYTHTHTHLVIQVRFHLSVAVFTCLPRLTPRSSAARGDSQWKEGKLKQHPGNQNALSKFALPVASALLTLVSSDHKEPQKLLTFSCNRPACLSV